MGSVGVGEAPYGSGEATGGGRERTLRGDGDGSGRKRGRSASKDGPKSPHSSPRAAGAVSTTGGGGAGFSRRNWRKPSLSGFTKEVQC